MKTSNLDIYQNGEYQTYSFTWNFYCWLFLSYFVYSIPSAYVLFRVLITIFDFKRRKLREGYQNVFFSIFLLDMFLNVSLFLVDLLSNRLPQTGLLTYYLSRINPSVWLTFVYCLFQYLQVACFYSSFSLTLLRFVTVSFPLTVHRIFPILYKVVICLIFIGPLATIWFLIPVYCFFRRVLDSPGSVNIDYERMFPSWKSSVCLVVVSLTLSILGLTCGLVTLIRIKVLLKHRSVEQQKRAELSVTLMTITSFSCLGLNTLMLCLFLAGGHVVGIHIQLLFIIRPYILDMLHFLPLWIFYLTHPAFRRKKSSTAPIHSGAPSGSRRNILFRGTIDSS